MTINILELLKIIETASLSKDTGSFCSSRDIFQARLDSYILHSEQYLPAAIIGEIGNNTFDHNWDFAKDHSRGTYLNLDYSGYIVLADFGRGLKNSLSTVKSCNSDLEAIKTAFTEHISGRAPEQRGNGLKFVCESVKEKNWTLYFQSGTACCIIENGNVTYKETAFSIMGCLAILHF